MKVDYVVPLLPNQSLELKSRLYIEIIFNREAAGCDVELLALREQSALGMSQEIVPMSSGCKIG